MGIASFDDCGTVWVYSGPEDTGDLYECTDIRCGDGTVLRVTRSEMSEPDKALPHEALMESWTDRKIPKEHDGYAMEMLGPITRATIAGKRGILIALKVTDPDDDSYISHAFRIPLDGHYLVMNATGSVDAAVIGGILEEAVSKVAIKEHRQ